MTRARSRRDDTRGVVKMLAYGVSVEPDARAYLNEVITHALIDARRLLTHERRTIARMRWARMCLFAARHARTMRATL